MNKISFLIFIFLFQVDLGHSYEKPLRSVAPISRPRKGKEPGGEKGKAAGGKKGKTTGYVRDSTIETTTISTTTTTTVPRITLQAFNYENITPDPLTEALRELKGQGQGKDKAPKVSSRTPWHEETLVLSLLSSVGADNQYITSVRPIDMASNMAKLTDSDFADKADFVNVQCQQYVKDHRRHQRKGWDFFDPTLQQPNQEVCENGLSPMLR